MRSRLRGLGGGDHSEAHDQAGREREGDNAELERNHTPPTAAVGAPWPRTRGCPDQRARWYGRPMEEPMKRKGRKRVAAPPSAADDDARSLALELAGMRPLQLVDPVALRLVLEEGESAWRHVTGTWLRVQTRGQWSQPSRATRWSRIAGCCSAWQRARSWRSGGDRWSGSRRTWRPAMWCWTSATDHRVRSPVQARPSSQSLASPASTASRP